MDEKDKNVTLTNEGIDSIERLLSNIGILKNNNFYDPANLNLVHHVNQALKANHIFLKDQVQSFFFALWFVLQLPILH